MYHFLSCVSLVHVQALYRDIQRRVAEAIRGEATRKAKAKKQSHRGKEGYVTKRKSERAVSLSSVVAPNSSSSELKIPSDFCESVPSIQWILDIVDVKESTKHGIDIISCSLDSKSRELTVTMSNDRCDAIQKYVDQLVDHFGPHRDIISEKGTTLFPIWQPFYTNANFPISKYDLKNTFDGCQYLRMLACEPRQVEELCKYIRYVISPPFISTPCSMSLRMRTSMFNDHRESDNGVDKKSVIIVRLPANDLLPATMQDIGKAIAENFKFPL
jgi:hypothetical protein